MAKGSKRAPSKAVLAERAACAGYVAARAGGYSELLASGRVSPEIVEHVGRVVALIAQDLTNGFHLADP